MTWYSGIDLHWTSSVVVVIDEADRVVYQRRLPNDLAQILAALQLYRGSSRAWWWNRPPTRRGERLGAPDGLALEQPALV